MLVERDGHELKHGTRRSRYVQTYILEETENRPERMSQAADHAEDRAATVNLDLDVLPPCRCILPKSIRVL